MSNTGHFCVHHTSFALVYPSIEVARAFQHVLAGFAVSSTRPSQLLHISHVAQTGGYFVESETRLVGNYRSVDELVTGLEWYLITKAIENAKALVIHAAALTNNTQTLLFPGQSGSGKTTLALAMALNGWHLLSDELAPLNIVNGTVEPFTRVLCIKTQTLSHFSAVDPQGLLNTPSSIHALNGILTLSPLTLSTADNAQSYPVTHIVFPTYKPDQSPQLYPLNKSETLKKLTACISNRSRLNQKAFDALTQIICDIPSFDLHSGPLDQTLHILEKL